MKNLNVAMILISLAGVASLPVLAGSTSVSETASAYIISPVNGQKVSSPVLVQFGLIGAGVAPAGVERANTGHHHLLIDVATFPDVNKAIPSDKNHRHFGGGQTEVQLDLDSGTHTLQLLLGDHNHVPHLTTVQSEPIIIHVQSVSE